MRKSKTNRAGNPKEPKPYDSCQTPPYALGPLLPYIPKDWVVWESASGEGLLVKGLVESGHRVCLSDIIPDGGEDFFLSEPTRYDCQITNPPFSLKYKWLKRSYDLGKPFALLMQVDVIGAKTAQRLFEQYGIEILLLDQRINFKMPYKGWEGKGAHFSVEWFTWGLKIGHTFTYIHMEDYREEE